LRLNTIGFPTRFNFSSRPITGRRLLVAAHHRPKVAGIFVYKIKD
jgi:hypothetical protein